MLLDYWLRFTHGLDFKFGFFSWLASLGSFERRLIRFPNIEGLWIKYFEWILELLRDN